MGDLVELRRRVLRWEEIVRRDSAMYSRLAHAVAGNDELLPLLDASLPGQLPMNMLLGAVHYLLADGTDDRLAHQYPSLGGAITEDLEVLFLEFALQHRDAIGEIMATHRVQTNEVARCSFLVPAYNFVSGITGQRLAIIEVGTSAGLNQNVARYGYTYNGSGTPVALQPTATLQLDCEVNGVPPELLRTLPDIAWHTGMDLHPVDVADDHQARWLRALVWPDQVERHDRLAAAIAIAREHPPGLIQGDGLDHLGDVVASAPPDTAIVVQHSFVLNQFSREEREAFYSLLDRLSDVRPIHRVSTELLSHELGPILAHTEHGADRRHTELARVHYHGRWIDWIN